MRQCEECGSSEFIEIHHKDKNRRNNSKENLAQLCSKCHQKKHINFYSGRTKQATCKHCNHNWIPRVDNPYKIDYVEGVSRPIERFKGLFNEVKR